MKKWGILFLLVVFGMGSCGDFEGFSVGLDDLGLGELDLLEQYIEDQNFVITSYVMGGEDKTSYFSGYEFLFSQSGTINAIVNNDTVDGLWSLSMADSIPKIEIEFKDAGKPLEELNEDWLVVKQEDDVVELKDISGKNGSVDYLTFMKI